MSLTSSSMTDTPRFRWLTRSPSWARRCTASRTGPRLIPSREASCTSLICSPGAKLPSRIRSRSCSAITAEVPLSAPGTMLSTPVICRGCLSSVSGQGASSHGNREVLVLQELLDPDPAAFPAKPGLLHGAERGGGVGHQPGVEADHGLL